MKAAIKVSFFQLQERTHVTLAHLAVSPFF